jgi:gamma-glutamylcyclotransferase (GGCT)/AIG2-like uncharacterized protein YtfP
MNGVADQEDRNLSDMMKNPYFAYGANMDGNILARRLGKADGFNFSRRRGVLRDYRLSFCKKSYSDPSVGYASISSFAGDVVEGVLNDIDEDDLRRLDEVELVPVHYHRRLLQVFDEQNGRYAIAHCYVASAGWIAAGLRPAADYIERMLGGGDILSDRYVETLANLKPQGGSADTRMHP